MSSLWLKTEQKLSIRFSKKKEMERKTGNESGICGKKGNESGILQKRKRKRKIINENREGKWGAIFRQKRKRQRNSGKANTESFQIYILRHVL
jgi:hypothetical protein